MRVLKSEKYAEEITKLMEDPIVLRMYDGMPYKHMLIFFHPKNEWDSIQQANRFYEKQGGKNQQSIGGVYHALKAIFEGGV